MPSLQWRSRPFVLAGAAILLCLAVSAIVLVRSRGPMSPRDMVASLPQTGAVLVYLDVAALRETGLLDAIAGTKTVQDPEYARFVAGTGFDYLRDLESVAGSFTGGSAFFTVRGRFDWPKLRDYAQKQGGTCKDSFCRTPGSEPRRQISFWPLRSGVMALASSPNSWAALDIAPRPKGAPAADAPDRPIWISVPPAALSEAAALPAGARSFTSPLASAERVVFSVNREGNALKLYLDVTAPTEQGASELESRLRGATEMLNKMLARENATPSEADLSGLLAGGAFRREGRRVHGQWPLHRKLIESIAGGSLS